jgi:Pyruvate/2-oxoacid:ferredoxin oxidoreductase gamma subunit
MTNTVMLGVLSLYLPVDVNIWEEVLMKSFPGNLAEMNLSAFAMGRNV